MKSDEDDSPILDETQLRPATGHPLDIGPLPTLEAANFTQGEDCAAYYFSRLLCRKLDNYDLDELIGFAKRGLNCRPDLFNLIISGIHESNPKPNLADLQTTYRRVWQCAVLNDFYRPKPDPFPAKGTRTSQCFTRIEPDGTTVAVLRIVESDGTQWLPTEVPDVVTPCQRASDLDRQRPGRKPSTKNTA